MINLPPYKIFSLGDSALTIDFGNIIDDNLNDLVISVFKKIQKQPIEGLTEAVPAYSSLTIYYNVVDLRKNIPEEQTVFDWMKNEVQKFLLQETENYQQEKRLIKIPVCYEPEFAIDIETAAAYLKLSTEEIIRIHTSKTYRVYMLGFLPGFAYMGEVDEKIVIPRKLQPIPVIEGSVGIAGKQTGAYSLNSPGGWQIIGRTPEKLFDKEKAEPVLLRSGDTVQFYSITKNEFENIKSRNS
jgi:inhibitor of KinA